jgi:hypothetical protein
MAWDGNTMPFKNVTNKINQYEKKELNSTIKVMVCYLK